MPGSDAESSADPPRVPCANNLFCPACDYFLIGTWEIERGVLRCTCRRCRRRCWFVIAHFRLEIAGTGEWPVVVV